VGWDSGWRRGLVAWDSGWRRGLVARDSGWRRGLVARDSGWRRGLVADLTNSYDEFEGCLTVHLPHEIMWNANSCN